MGTLATPMINYGKLEKRNGHLLYHDVLKNSHERKLVTDLKANVVAEERVKQFEFLIFPYRRSHVDLLSRTVSRSVIFHLHSKYTEGSEGKTGRNACPTLTAP